jgi:L-2-hydroxyglutarate oxidase LhgO
LLLFFRKEDLSSFTMSMESMQEIDTIVVGAGVVGLAIAQTLSRNGIETLTLEGERAPGTWTSSRNSEVIHAGLYYPAGSLKAELCVEGKKRLYAFCMRNNVPFKRIGKLVVAHTPDQLPILEAVARTAAANGVDDVRHLSAAEATSLEPALSCAGALFSPSTGIVDSYAYMQALLADAEAHGATLACNTRVTRIARRDGKWHVWIEGENDAVVTAPRLINAAGLAAPAIAANIEGLDPQYVPQPFYARGVYFTYSGRTPFAHLIYPVPQPGHLGTHLTLDLAGQARFGPDMEWIDKVDYTVDPNRHAAFAEAAHRIWPGLDPSKLQPGYAGIRPKLVPMGVPDADFRIDGPGRHGLEGLVNLFGIESPGLTASLAIADLVHRQLAA